MLRFLGLTAVLFIIPFAIHAARIVFTSRRWPERADFPMGRVLVFSLVGAVLVLIGIVWLVLSEDGIVGGAETAALAFGAAAG